MKVSGFSFIRNAIKYDYPVNESINSILPLCDEFVIAVGKSEDNTLELIRSLNNSKIKIIETVWDESLRKGGQVLANETNKAFKALSENSDWAFYMQADEVLHEKYLPAVKNAMSKWLNKTEVEGLLFNYLHFYGSYDYIADSRKWYRREIRIIRNDKSIHSFRDAQGFRKNNKLIRVKPVNATIYHYGWVKPPALQQSKQESFHKYWHNDQWIEKNIKGTQEFDYSQIDSLKKFNGSHPGVMKERINKKNWHFSSDPSDKKFSLISRILYYIEKKTNWRIGEYKNFKII